MVIKELKNAPTPLPEEDGTYKVFVDNGYAQNKIAYWAEVDGTKQLVNFLLPSRAQMGRVNVDVHGRASGVYTVNGSDYTVGEDVRDPETIRSKQYAHSEINCALVMHTLIAAGFSGLKIRLGTGLPFDHYFRNREVDKAFIKKITESLSSECISASGSEMPIIVSHRVYPESTAAAVAFSLDIDSGDFKTFENGLVVIDMGGDTTDITVINRDFTINIDESGSRQLGVIDIRTKLSSLITDKFEVSGITDSQLDRALRTGSIKIYGQDEGISDLREQAKAMTVKKLGTFINETVGEAAFIDTILFVGGGASILEDSFKSTFKQAQVPENPEFQNANGALYYMTHIEE